LVTNWIAGTEAVKVDTKEEERVCKPPSQEATMVSLLGGGDSALSLTFCLCLRLRWILNPSHDEDNKGTMKAATSDKVQYSITKKPEVWEPISTVVSLVAIADFAEKINHMLFGK
jgi:hypothetical protein